MDRIKRLSYEVLETHKSKFGENFADNKKILDQISIIRSKGLKNEVAGYITKFIKKEIRDEKTKQLQVESSKNQEQQKEESPGIEKNDEFVEVDASEDVVSSSSSEQINENEVDLSITIDTSDETTAEKFE